jgi:putative redox protein
MATSERTTTTLHHLVGKRFVGITPDDMRVIIDGEAAHKTGMNPMQLVLNALAGCAAFDVVEMIAKRRLAVRHYRVEMSGERRDTAPRSFVRIHSRHVLDVPGLDQAMAERFVELATTKYCSVAGSLTAEQTFEVVLEGDPTATEGGEAPGDEPAALSRH